MWTKDPQADVVECSIGRLEVNGTGTTKGECCSVHVQLDKRISCRMMALRVLIRILFEEKDSEEQPMVLVQSTNLLLFY